MKVLKFHLSSRHEHTIRALKLQNYEIENPFKTSAGKSLKHFLNAFRQIRFNNSAGNLRLAYNKAYKNRQVKSHLLNLEETVIPKLDRQTLHKEVGKSCTKLFFLSVTAFCT